MHRTRAQESRAAIERLYITMRHLFNLGSYKPMGVSGEGLIQALMVLSPEIYGKLTDPEKINWMAYSMSWNAFQKESKNADLYA